MEANSHVCQTIPFCFDKKYFTELYFPVDLLNEFIFLCIYFCLQHLPFPWFASPAHLSAQAGAEG